MARLTARTEHDHVVVELQDATGAPAQVALDRHEIVGLMSDLTRCLNELPFDPVTPIYGQQPVLRSKNPSFQVGMTDNGDCMLAIRPDPLPPMHFSFDAQALSKLLVGLRQAAITPSTKPGKQ